jgi:dipeptidyl-peptidase 4
MNKRFFLLLAVMALSAAAFSQPTGGGSMNWAPDGNSYTTIEKGKIVKVELPSMNKTTLIESEKLFPKDSIHPRQISAFQWSANDEKVLLFVNTETQYHKTTGEVWLYVIKTGTLKQLGKGLRQEGLMYAKFSPDAGNVAYVYQDKSKNKVVYNLYVENLISGKIKQLTFDTRDRCINGTFDWVYSEELFCKDGFRWNPDGKSIAYWNIDASQVRNYLMLNTTDSTYSFTVAVEYPKAGEDPSPAKIGVVDIATAKTKWMNIAGDPRQNYLVRMEWAGDHELIIQQLNRKQNKTNILLADSKTAACKVLWSESDAAWIDIKATWNGGDNMGWDWIENRKAFIWASEKDGWRHLYRIGMDGKETLITKGNFDVMRLNLIDETNNTLYFAASPDNYTQRYLFRTNLDGSGNAEILTSIDLPGTHNYVMSPNGKWARHNFSSHLYIPASEWISLKDMKPLDENKSIAKNLKEDPYGKQIEYFKVTTEDTITLDGWIAKPKDFDPSKKYPVFFQVYGEPWSSTVMDSYGIGRNSQFGDNIPDQGYLFVSIDNRGTPSPRGREWRKSIYRKIGIVNIRDLAMGAKEILKRPYCDTSRVAVTGWSGGGSSTLNLMFQYPGIFKTGIAVAAVGNQLAYDNTYQERYMGIPQETRADFVAGSPYTYAKNLRGNLLYIHGTGDDNVHYSNAEKLINELIRYNKPFQMMAYPMRSHGIYEGTGTREHLKTISSKFLHENCPAGGR